MTTLYDKLIECKKNNSSSWVLNPEISSQLVLILQKSCGINLSGEITPFVQNIALFNSEITIDYKFKYGSASVSTKKTELEVSFFFVRREGDDYYIPFDSNRCKVMVDHDLNFKGASINFFSTFSNQTLKGRDSTVLKMSNNRMVGTLLVEDPKYGSIHIKRVVLENGDSFNSITYDNFRSKIGEYADLVGSGLHERFFRPDRAFETLFMKFMAFCSKHPHEFYAVFPEYPSYIKFVEHQRSAIEFLNLFNEQYTNDLKLLKSNIILLDMQAI